MDTKPKKSFFKRYWWIGIVAISLILGAGLLIMKSLNNSDDANTDISGKEKKVDANEFNWPSTTAKYITAVPVDLTQISYISKYRSCVGHDRSGWTFDKVFETDRSMKHYFFPTAEFQATQDKVAMYAPFDGTVADLMWEKPDEQRPNNGNGIHLATSVDPNALFGFGHIYFVKDFQVGEKVKAGQLLGYAAVSRVGDDFDLDLFTPGGTCAYQCQEVLDSIFDHMTDSVLAEFAKYGITPDNTKFSKEYRDANPCNFNSDEFNPDVACPAPTGDKTSDRHDDNECWVKLIR